MTKPTYAKRIAALVVGALKQEMKFSRNPEPIVEALAEYEKWKEGKK